MRARELTGHTFGHLTVLRRVPSDNGHAHWLCECDCGRMSVVTTSNLVSGRSRSCGNFTKHIDVRPNAKVGVPTYQAIHKRLVRSRGKASIHACADCGAPAREWSLDPAPFIITTQGGYRYSLDLDDYSPRCVPCHRALDKAVA